MPLINTVNDNGLQYILWDAKEPVDFFMDSIALNNYEKARLENIKHPLRALQFICARYLLRELLPAAPQTCFQAEDDVPIVNGRPEYISISHSENLVAVMVHEDTPCGIDVQHFDPRILRIKDKFSTEEERALFNLSYTELLHCTLLWAAKEAVYKCMHTKGLDFKTDMVLTKVLYDHLIIKYTRKNIDIEVPYILGDGYYLGWCMMTHN